MEYAQPGQEVAGVNAARWPIVALLLAALLPLASTPVLPMIDFYNHVMRFDLLRRLGSDPVLDAHYRADWGVLPNIALDVLAVGLLGFVPADWLPHLLTVLVMVVQFAGVMLLSRALSGRFHWFTALLTVPLLYSWILNWGFVNFLFGLGLAMAATAWWISQRDRPLRRLALAVPAAVLIFFAHGVAFALYGIAIATFEIGHWWQGAGWKGAGGGRWRPSALVALAGALGLCAVWAVVPALLFARSRTVGASGGLTNADESVLRLLHDGMLFKRLQALFAHRLEAMVRVAEGPDYALDALWLAALLLLLALLWRARLLRLAPVAGPPLLAGALLVLLCPPAMFGVGYVADRMPLYVALLGVACLRPAPGLGPRHPAALALAALVAVRLVSIGWQWQGLATDLTDLDRVAAGLPPHSLVVGIAPGATPHDEVPRRCEMYIHILGRRQNHIVPVFAIGTAQPIKLKGRLAAARDRANLASAALRLKSGIGDQPAPLVTALASSGFDQLLLCQVSRNAPRGPLPLPVLAEAGRFRLVDLRPGNAARPVPPV